MLNGFVDILSEKNVLKQIKVKKTSVRKMYLNFFRALELLTTLFSHEGH